MEAKCSALVCPQSQTSPISGPWGELKALRDEVLSGLSEYPKALPSKLLFDERGVLLLDCLSSMPEYYPIRAEIEILERYAGEIVAAVGPEAAMMAGRSGDAGEDFSSCRGKGGSRIPIDRYLGTVEGWNGLRQPLRVVSGSGEHSRQLSPSSGAEAKRLVLYLQGATCCKLPPRETQHLLKTSAQSCGPNGGILIGVDLKKDVKIIERTYNDRLGIAAAFNLNILERLNRELGSNFNLRWFQHRVVCDERHGRTELQLVSLRDQRVCIGGTEVSLRAYETIRTAQYYQYTLERFARLANAAKVQVQRVWMDEARLFSLQYLKPDVLERKVAHSRLAIVEPSGLTARETDSEAARSRLSESLTD